MDKVERYLTSWRKDICFLIFYRFNYRKGILTLKKLNNFVNKVYLCKSFIGSCSFNQLSR